MENDYGVLLIAFAIILTIFMLAYFRSKRRVDIIIDLINGQRIIKHTYLTQVNRELEEIRSQGTFVGNDWYPKERIHRVRVEQLD